jgi:phosphatidate cytidylyltransferase
MTLSALVAVRCTAALEPFGAVVLCIGIMASVWINDSFAYLVGSRFGKHKMVPKISPKKSWEGLAGGIVGSVATWLALLAFPATHVTLPVALACGVACGVMGVIGDLVESRIKRGAGVKDSGDLIPGHGGLLDRSDSMLFVSITAYFLLRMMGVI